MITSCTHGWRTFLDRPVGLVALAATLWLGCSVACAGATSEVPAQADAKTHKVVAPPQGSFTGTLGSLHLRLHLDAAADGTLAGTLDSVDQGAMGIPCTDFHASGQSLSFRVPTVQGAWTGTIDATGTTLSGTWTQGTSAPLTFKRDTFVTAATPSAIDGYWLGTLKAGSQSLRIQVSLQSDASGHERCTLDSLDQGAFGLACENVSFRGQDLAFDIPAVKGHWGGKLSADGASLRGTWSQGQPLPLDFARQARSQAPPPPPPVTYDPAIAPVDAAGMKAVLDRDLSLALEDGALAPGTGTGVAIGIVRNGDRRVLAYGAATPDALFEIGSITKTFTGLLLAQLVEQQQLGMDTPVRELLPPGTVGKPRDREIQLLDLVTQHSGLPRMPDNFDPADPANPYADYRAADLYRFIARHGVARRADAPYEYSNLGVGLLGQALSNCAGVPYDQLLRDEITLPLGLHDTVISPSPAQQARFIQGHTADHGVAHAWDMDALAGAGAIRSTAADMLGYLEANLHPERFASQASTKQPADTLASALALSHEARDLALPGMHIAFAWMIEDATGTYWHNGSTGGYSSFAFFNPRSDYAAVVLVNVAADSRGSLADRLGQHVAQRFEGKPALSLGSL